MFLDAATKSDLRRAEPTLFYDGMQVGSEPELPLPSIGTGSLSIGDYLFWLTTQQADAKVRVEKALTPDPSPNAWNILLDARRDLEESTAASAASAFKLTEPQPVDRSDLSMHRRSELEETTFGNFGSALEAQIHREMVEHCAEIDAPKVLTYWTRRTEMVNASRKAKCAATLVGETSQEAPRGNTSRNTSKSPTTSVVSLPKHRTNTTRRSRRARIPSDQLTAECARAVALNPKAVADITNSDAVPAASQVNEEILPKHRINTTRWNRRANIPSDQLISVREPLR